MFSKDGRTGFNPIEVVVTLALVALQAAIIVPVFSH